jgi:hypothetical protein
MDEIQNAAPALLRRLRRLEAVAEAAAKWRDVADDCRYEGEMTDDDRPPKVTYADVQAAQGLVLLALRELEEAEHG